MTGHKQIMFPAVMQEVLTRRTQQGSRNTGFGIMCRSDDRWQESERNIRYCPITHRRELHVIFIGGERKRYEWCMQSVMR